MTKKKKEKGLGWKDYIALTIAMLTTTLLPFLVFFSILFAALLVVIVILG